MKTFQLYAITNTINGKIYIGKTVNSLMDRWSRHKREAIKYKNQTHLYRSMDKYGVENFKIEVIAYFDSHEILLEEERFWISEMRHYLGVNNVYNETNGGEGGEGVEGFKVSDLSKMKISSTLKNFHASLSENEKEEKYKRLKMNPPHLGLKHSESTKKKMSNSHSERIHPKTGPKINNSWLNKLRKLLQLKDL